MELKKLIYRFIKFGIVGASGTIIDFAITAIVMLALGLREYITESIATISQDSSTNNILILILFANFVGFVVAATSNFFLNRIWTWKSTDPNVKKQYIKFFAVSVGGLIINLIVIYLCNSFLSWELTIFGVFISRFWIAKLIATAVVMFWNFIVNNIYTFKS